MKFSIFIELCVTTTAISFRIFSSTQKKLRLVNYSFFLLLLLAAGMVPSIVSVQPAHFNEWMAAYLKGQRKLQREAAQCLLRHLNINLRICLILQFILHCFSLVITIANYLLCAKLYPEWFAYVILLILKTTLSITQTRKPTWDLINLPKVIQLTGITTLTLSKLLPPVIEDNCAWALF